MSFEPNYKKVKSSIRKNIGTTQSIVEFKLPTSEREITDVYSVGAAVSISSAEISGNVVNFMGLVDFQVVYQSMGVASGDFTAEFRDKYDSGEELSGELILNASVMQVSSNLVGGEIRVSTTVEVSIDIIETREVPVLVSLEDGNAYKTYKDITYSTYVGKAYEKLDITSTIEIKDARAVYVVTPCVRLSSVEARDNYIAVKGVAGLDICYQMGEDLSHLRSTYREVDFDWEIAYDGLTAESNIESMISVVYNEIKVSSVAGEDGTEIDINIPVMFNGYVYNTVTMSVVDDIYLESNYLSVTSEVMPTITDFNNITFIDNISGSAEVNESQPFIDEILSVCINNVVVARNYIDDGRLVVEGVAQVTVTYYTKENMSATALDIEMPFAVDQKVGGDNSSVVTICITDITAKSRRGKEIDVSGELYVFADTYTSDNIVVISNITLGEEKKVDECSLYLYIVKPNQTVWDIAKEMNVSPDMILEQNPGSDNGISAGQKLVIYRSRSIEY